jgi:hypothetical protein
MEPLIRRGGPATDWAVRFDYRHAPDAELSGTPWPLTASEFCVDFSHYSRSDHQPDAALASDDELDYALLRLGAAPAADAPGNSRGWLSLDAAPSPKPEEPLLILQHPRGQRLKLCFGRVLSVGNSRFRYDTNTDAGASGAPCLDEDLELVGLHHMGDPNFDPSHAAAYNQGIPTALIARRLATRGIRLPVKC